MEADYTFNLENLQPDLIAEDNDFRARLIEAVKGFRSFDEALDGFILLHGFEGDISSAEEKTAFITGRFKSAEIEPPRNIMKWFTEHKSIKRDIAFRLAFAFSLSYDETEEFFRRVCLDRGFDCHSCEELIYYYCIRNGLSYGEARNAADKVCSVRDGIKEMPVPGDIKYTGAIIKDINLLSGLDQVTDYICGNIDQFEYNNVTARRMITKLWGMISGENGLAMRELIKKAPPEVYGETAKAISGKYSDMDTYLQIIGVDSVTMGKLSADGRSLSPAFEENRLIHSLAAASFPSRLGINKIINGQRVTHETVRKTLILLSFYSYWAGRAVNRTGGNIYAAAPEDMRRSIAEINSYLLDSGYPELYAGNPYDWIILWACQDAYPLESFRFYLGEVVAEKLNSEEADEE